ncbi:MAG: hypothetical protein JWN04_5232 [Myxococcaceae bacterium]|nr:hypothetical protein [Myxococcaceae bacterium]
MVGSEGTVTIPLKAYYWKCIDSSCVWTQFESGNIAPGYVHWVSGTGKFFYKATMSGAGKGTQVSMAINLAPMACGACNDGTCQCGHMPAADLCADHRGVDTGLGCLQQQ